MRVLKIAVGIIALVVLVMDGKAQTALAIVAITAMMMEIEHWTNTRRRP